MTQQTKNDPTSLTEKQHENRSPDAQNLPELDKSIPKEAVILLISIEYRTLSASTSEPTTTYNQHEIVNLSEQESFCHSSALLAKAMLKTLAAECDQRVIQFEAANVVYRKHRDSRVFFQERIFFSEVHSLDKDGYKSMLAA